MRNIIASSVLLLSNQLFAGQGSGGGLGAKQLQDMAISERILSVADIQEELGEESQGHGKGSRSVIRERNSMEPAGVIVNLPSPEFELVAEDASHGKDFIYRDATVRARAMEPGSRFVTMYLVEDPSILIVVQESETASR